MATVTTIVPAGATLAVLRLPLLKGMSNTVRIDVSTGARSHGTSITLKRTTAGVDHVLDNVLADTVQHSIVVQQPTSANAPVVFTVHNMENIFVTVYASALISDPLCSMVYI